MQFENVEIEQKKVILIGIPKIRQLKKIKMMLKKRYLNGIPKLVQE
jgi:hypothetical protein